MIMYKNSKGLLLCYFIWVPNKGTYLILDRWHVKLLGHLPLTTESKRRNIVTMDTKAAARSSLLGSEGYWQQGKCDPTCKGSMSGERKLLYLIHV